MQIENSKKIEPLPFKKKAWLNLEDTNYATWNHNFVTCLRLYGNDAVLTYGYVWISTVSYLVYQWWHLVTKRAAEFEGLKYYYSVGITFELPNVYQFPFLKTLGWINQNTIYCKNTYQRNADFIIYIMCTNSDHHILKIVEHHCKAQLLFQLLICHIWDVGFIIFQCFGNSSNKM